MELPETMAPLARVACAAETGTEMTTSAAKAACVCARGGEWGRKGLNKHESSTAPSGSAAPCALTGFSPRIDKIFPINFEAMFELLGFRV